MFNPNSFKNFPLSFQVECDPMTEEHFKKHTHDTLHRAWAGHISMDIRKTIKFIMNDACPCICNAVLCFGMSWAQGQCIRIQWTYSITISTFIKMNDPSFAMVLICRSSNSKIRTYGGYMPQLKQVEFVEGIAEEKL